MAFSKQTKHALHFVQNLQIPKSVSRTFDRYGICMKYQRRWYKICACGLCVKFKIKDLLPTLHCTVIGLTGER